MGPKGKSAGALSDAGTLVDAVRRDPRRALPAGL
jgi:hypothetical protein